MGGMGWRTKVEGASKAYTTEGQQVQKLQSNKAMVGFSTRLEDLE